MKNATNNLFEEKLHKYVSGFVDESEDSFMAIQEEKNIIEQSKPVLSELATIDFTTARRLADNEYRKSIALRKTRDEARLSGLKVSKQFLSKRKSEEQNPQEKLVYSQKISQIDMDISRLTGIVSRQPPKETMTPKTAATKPAGTPLGAAV